MFLGRSFTERQLELGFSSRPLTRVVPTPNHGRSRRTFDGSSRDQATCTPHLHSTHVQFSQVHRGFSHVRTSSPQLQSVPQVQSSHVQLGLAQVLAFLIKGPPVDSTLQR